ncbi:MAG: glycosyltransferase family 4 protein [Elusimicrobiaceae bacterium]
MSVPLKKTEPLSVIMVSASFWPHVGGSERQALEQARYLVSKGVKVSVVTRRLGNTLGRELVQGVPVRRLKVFGRKGFLNSVSFMCGLFFYLLRHRAEYEIIHVHFASSPALPAGLAARLLGKKFLVKIGGGRGVGEIAGSRNTLAGKLKLKLLARLKPLFLVVNSDLKDELESAGISSANAAVFPNGVDTEFFSPVSEKEKLELRARLKINGGPVFLYTGRFSPEKRLPWFVDVWAGAAASCPGNNAVLLLVGEGPDRLAIEQSVKAVSHHGHRIFMHGRQDDIRNFYRAADVFVLPSVSEGLSNSMLEAMACANAVLVSRTGGAKDAVENGKNGFLFEPADKKALKDTLVRLICGQDLARAAGAAARVRAENEYAMEKVGARLMKLYSDLPRG